VVLRRKSLKGKNQEEASNREEPSPGEGGELFLSTRETRLQEVESVGINALWQHGCRLPGRDEQIHEWVVNVPLSKDLVSRKID